MSLQSVRFTGVPPCSDLPWVAQTSRWNESGELPIGPLYGTHRTCPARGGPARPALGNRDTDRGRPFPWRTGQRKCLARTGDTACRAVCRADGHRRPCADARSGPPRRTLGDRGDGRADRAPPRSPAVQSVGGNQPGRYCAHHFGRFRSGARLAPVQRGSSRSARQSVPADCARRHLFRGLAARSGCARGLSRWWC